MSGPPFDFGLRAFTEFWGKAAQQANETATRAFTDSVKLMSGQGGAGIPPMPDLTKLVPDTAEVTRAGQAVADLWKAATNLSTSLTTGLATGDAGTGKALDPTVEATFRAMTNPRTWLAGLGGMDSVIGQVAEGPQLADLWNAERLQARVVQAWFEVRRRALEHNAVVIGAWMRAARAYGEELAARTRAEGRAPDAKAALALWTETANRVLLETQRSEEFLKTQAAMIRAGTEFRLAQRDLAERWAAPFGLPTRTELDDVHRTVTELRRELRALRRETRERSKGTARVVALPKGKARQEGEGA